MNYFFVTCHISTKGQCSPNEFLNTFKPFDLIKLCLFYSSIFVMSITILSASISCKDILYSYNKNSLIFYVVNLL
jgi:hypothetical protein